MSAANPLIVDLVVQHLASQAQSGVYAAVNGERPRSLHPRAVVRWEVPDGAEHKSPGQGGAGVQYTVLPGILVSPFNISRPVDAGQNCEDEEHHSLVIQIVDGSGFSEYTCRHSWARWAKSITQYLQSNPFRNQVDLTVEGDLFLVHASDLSPSDVPSFQTHGQLQYLLRADYFIRVHR